MEPPPENPHEKINVRGELELKSALPLFLIVMLDAFSWTVIFPLLPFYAVAFGANLFTLGLLIAISPVIEILAAPVHRIVSKKVGRKPVLTLSQLGMILGYLILGFAQTLGALFLARIVDGIAGANNTIGRRLIRDELSEHTRAKAMGLIEAAYSFGFLAGPFVGFLVLELTDDDYQMIPFVAAGITLVVMLITIFSTKETLPPEKRQSSGQSIKDKVGEIAAVTRQPVMRFLLILLFVQMFSFMGFIQFSGLFTLARIGANGVTFMLIAVVAFLLIIFIQAGAVGWLSKRFGERWMIIIGLGLLGGGLILSSATPAVPVPWYSKTELEAELSSDQMFVGEIDLYRVLTFELPEEAKTGWMGFGWFAISLLLIILGGGLLTPSINSFLVDAAPDYASGGMLGLSNILNKMVEVSAPIVFGLTLWFFGWSVPFFIGGMIILVLLVFALRRINST